MGAEIFVAEAAAAAVTAWLRPAMVIETAAQPAEEGTTVSGMDMVRWGSSRWFCGSRSVYAHYHVHAI